MSTFRISRLARGTDLTGNEDLPIFNGRKQTRVRMSDLLRSPQALAAIQQAVGMNSLGVPSAHYHASYRGWQTNKGPLVDQSAKMHDAVPNAKIFPAAYSATAVYAVGDRLVPTTPNGMLYRVTTAPGVAAGAEPAAGNYPLIVGNTVNTTGGTVLTAERGGYFLTSGGYPQFYSLSSAQLGASGGQVLGMVDFDAAAGDSLIVIMGGAFNFTNGGYNNQNIDDKTILSNVRAPGAATIRRGFRIFALGTGSGTAFNDLCFGITDGTNNRKVAHLSNTAAAHPGDGTWHSTMFAYDGQLKRLFTFADGNARSNPTDYTGVNATNLVGWNADFSAVTGSTKSDAPLVLGGDPDLVGNGPAATSYELGLQRLDILLFKGRGLPPYLSQIAMHGHLRDSPIPQSLTI